MCGETKENGREKTKKPGSVGGEGRRGNEEVALPRKIERLEAIFANINQLSDIARNDRPPTAVLVDTVVAVVAAVVLVVIVVVVVDDVDDDDDRNSIWLARLEIGRATYPSGCFYPEGAR